MSWFRVDDRFPSHPKVEGLSNSAVGLWLKAGCWSSQYDMDGHIPYGIVARLGRRRCRDELVKAGLWTEGPMGVVMHDWDQWNSTRAQRVKRRADDAARQREWRESGANRARNGREMGASHTVT